MDRASVYRSLRYRAIVASATNPRQVPRFRQAIWALTHVAQTIPLLIGFLSAINHRWHTSGIHAF
jgi:hypothetical protein